MKKSKGRKIFAVKKRRLGIGSLPDFELQNLVNKGLFSKKALKYISIGPASIDLSSTTEMYRIEKNILPEPGQKIRNLLKAMNATKHSIKNPLEREVQYICCVGKMKIPKGVYGLSNAKSSSGRIDLHVRLMSDNIHKYNTLASGEAEIWLHLTANSFPVISPDNTPLLQVRLFNGDSRMKVSDILKLNRKAKPSEKFLSYPKDQSKLKKNISWDKFSRETGKKIILSLNIPMNGLVGWKAKKTNKILDLSRRDFLVQDFFEPVYSQAGKLDLDKDCFYILSTREYIYIPERFSGEMVANDVHLGEFRTHYAGFFDPGFAGEGVLEVRPQENISFWHGQPIVTFKIERMAALPDTSYKVGHNYHGQRGPKLAKFFKENKI